MKKKYILQIKRHYLWEDVATFCDFDSALFYLTNFKKNGIYCRLVEICIL